MLFVTVTQIMRMLKNNSGESLLDILKIYEHSQKKTDTNKALCLMPETKMKHRQENQKK